LLGLFLVAVLALGLLQRAAVAEIDREFDARAAARLAEAAAARKRLATVRIADPAVAQARDLLVLEAGRLVENCGRAHTCWADLSDGTGSALSIADLGNRFDVVLAGGKGFGGKVYFNPTYGGDFVGAGLIGHTTASDGKKMVFFDWGPVQWDGSLKYRAVRLVLPVKVRAATLTGGEKAAIPVQTEKNVHEENRIDWYGSRGENRTYALTGLFHQTDVLGSTSSAGASPNSGTTSRSLRSTPKHLVCAPT
jgi:hypothetical protein